MKQWYQRRVREGDSTPNLINNDAKVGYHFTFLLFGSVLFLHDVTRRKKWIDNNFWVVVQSTGTIQNLRTNLYQIQHVRARYLLSPSSNLPLEKKLQICTRLGTNGT
eukprot:TRINITY_DN4826_c0_g1_i4.p1 TRINITY_DN4826_c0_g1~~TRINITY_DN4826_c0_g1_i4.p1  ORF type:complete len:107 (-),score=25.75 TRINITY_DN4826_c0_g1_i4:298-618(-)